MACKNTFKYMCGTCRETFNDLGEHVLKAGHHDEEKLVVGFFGVSENSGNVCYAMTRFNSTYAEIKRHIQEGREVYVEDRKLKHTVRPSVSPDNSWYDEDPDIILPQLELYSQVAMT